MTTEENEQRLQLALESLCADDLDNPGETISEAFCRSFGEVGDPCVEEYFATIVRLYQVFRLQGKPPMASLFCIFLTGAHLGKRIGVAEGASLPRLEG